MSRQVDVLVVGAGIYGAAVAHEAVRRGASVLLVDRGDIAGGASSNSLKVGHGGLRYLQSLDLSRFFESVRERRRWLRDAAPWVAPATFRLDRSGHGIGYRLLLRAGLVVNDLLTPHRNRGVPPPNRLGRSRYPTWQDVQLRDPERILLSLLHGARSAGPGSLEVATYCGVRELRCEGDRVGAQLEDGSRVECTHAFRCVGAHRAGEPAVVAMNLVVDALGMGGDSDATVLAHPDDGRNVFIVPWRGRSMIGTWYFDHPGDPVGRFELRPQWAGEMLRWLAPVHPRLAALSAEDIRLVHAGALPRSPGARDPEPASRKRIESPMPGVTDVVGVKWTTAWGVAIEAVEGALETAPGRPGRAPERLPDLPGRAASEREALRLAVEAEWATRLDDVLLRRVPIAATGHPGVPRVEAASRVLQSLLDWSERERRAQVEAFHALPVFAGNVPAR